MRGFVIQDSIINWSQLEPIILIGVLLLLIIWIVVRGSRRIQRQTNSKTVDHLDAYSMYYSHGDYNRAIAEITQAIKHMPQRGDLYAGRAACYSAMQDSRMAIADCTQALKLGYKNISTYFTRALEYDRIGRYKEAIDDYTNFIKLDPQGYGGRDRLGFVYHSRGPIMES